MDRHDLLIRQRTSITQKLPENFEEKLQKFQAFIIAERKKHKYELSLIGTQTKLRLPLTCLQIIQWTRKEKRQCQS